MSKLTTPLLVREAMLSKIAGSSLDAKDAAKLKFRYLTALQSKELDVPVNLAGFVIPYFDISGKLTNFWRYRYLEETRKGFDILSGRKALRYVQASGGVNEVYLAPFMDWKLVVKNTTIPLIITEGELKAASVTKTKMPCIGLGGVFCFKSTKGREAMLPMLRLFYWNGREVFIAYDSDAVTNPMVILAENQLASLLTRHGARVKIARLMPAEDGSKIGVDDYLLSHTAEQLKEVLAQAEYYSESIALHEMNELVSYVRDPGLVYDHVNKMRLSCTNYTQHAYSNFWYKVETARPDGSIKAEDRSTSLAWIKWPYRSELESITFAPGEPKIFGRKLNLWEGWAVEPKRGNVRPWKELLDHIFANTEQEARKWFEQWVAYPLQNPGKKMVTAVVCWGKVHGSGKSMIGYTIMKVYGKYAAEINDTQIEDTTNAWGENKQFILADDITGHNNRRLANRLKTMCSQQVLNIDQKYVPKYSVPDCLNYYFTSNDPDAFYLDDGDRRFFIHEVRSGKLSDEFRHKFVEWRNQKENLAALFHYFLNIDLAGFDPFADAYVTDAKREMTQLVKSDLVSWISDLKEGGDKKLKLKGDLFTSKELLAAYDPAGTSKVMANGMARELKRAGYRTPGRTGAMSMTNIGNVRLFAIRNPEKWVIATAPKIREHYEVNRAMEVKAAAEKKKPKF